MYQQDRAWESSYHTQVIEILNTLLQYLATLSVAPREMDNKCATDFELKLMGGTVAVRLRRPDCRYRDLTIRAERDSGAVTELAKIQAGHAFRYFYGWTDNEGRIKEWMLIDLDKARSAGLLEKKRTLIANKHPDGSPDGTYFIAIKRRELEEAGCLIAQFGFTVNTTTPCTPATNEVASRYIKKNVKSARRKKGNEALLYSSMLFPKEEQILEEIGRVLEEQSSWGEDLREVEYE
jgi:hypothetical protein